MAVQNSMKTYLKINPKDNVAVLLAPLACGTRIEADGAAVSLKEDISQGHKVALRDISCGEEIIKYGLPIGVAKENISAGSWVHTHNIRTGLGELLSYTYDRQAVRLTPTEERFFQGYRRKNGKAAVRNELWIVPTVGCVNSIASAIEKKRSIWSAARSKRLPHSRTPTAVPRWEKIRSIQDRFLPI